MTNQNNINPVVLRLLVIGGIVLFQLIPLFMIRNLIEEREARSEEARTDIQRKWGGPQEIQGPFLAIPYHVNATGGNPARSGELLLLPDELQVQGNVESERRRRGIFETVLYTTDLKLKGNFRIPGEGELRGRLPLGGKLSMGRAHLTVFFSDNRGLRKTGQLHWNGRKTPLLSGSGNSSRSGIHAPVSAEDPGSVPFAFELKLLGSRELSFIPAGKNTKVELSSNWSSPSFTGSYLPDTREIGSEGFRASWEITGAGGDGDSTMLLADEYTAPVMGESAFGVNLISPLGHYHETERAVKYALLFLVLTFTGFFLFEIFNRYRIHPIQYTLVGFAMVLFYALFLSLTEQIPFLPAYTISTVATVGLITFYSIHILRNRNRGLAMGGFLSALYFYLYVVLRSEDYALIMGTTGLFFILGLVMFITRHLDWYSIRMTGEMEPAIKRNPA